MSTKRLKIRISDKANGKNLSERKAGAVQPDDLFGSEYWGSIPVLNDIIQGLVQEYKKLNRDKSSEVDI